MKDLRCWQMLLGLLAVVTTAAATSPAYSTAARRVFPLFERVEVPDALADRLWRVVERAGVPAATAGPVARRSPPRNRLSFFGADRPMVAMRLQRGRRDVWRDDVVREIRPEDVAAFEAAAHELEELLAAEVRAAPKPCDYRIGTLEDGGTLRGVARAVYGDAAAWTRIAELNRATLPDPDRIPAGAILRLP